MTQRFFIQLDCDGQRRIGRCIVFVSSMNEALAAAVQGIPSETKTVELQVQRLGDGGPDIDQLRQTVRQAVTILGEYGSWTTAAQRGGSVDRAYHLLADLLGEQEGG